MATETFTVGSVDLSSRDPVTGLQHTANIYHVAGIDRELSAGQLVMAICLTRASELEAKIVEMMAAMAQTTRLIEDLTNFESKIVDRQDKVSSIGKTFEGVGYKDKDEQLPLNDSGQQFDWKAEWAKQWFHWDNSDTTKHLIAKPDTFNVNDFSKNDRETYQKLMDNIETKLDSLNTTSQKQMIELQSTTNKRDQTYDLCTSFVKSFYSAQGAIFANFR